MYIRPHMPIIFAFLHYCCRMYYHYGMDRGDRLFKKAFTIKFFYLPRKFFWFIETYSIDILHVVDFFDYHTMIDIASDMTEEDSCPAAVLPKYVPELPYKKGDTRIQTVRVFRTWFNAYNKNFTKRAPQAFFGHAAHVISPSILPVTFSAFLGLAAVTLLATIRSEGGADLFAVLHGFSVAGLMSVMYVWFYETWREEIGGCHTRQVKRGLLLGIYLFVLSEAMLFLSFFFAYLFNGFNTSYAVHGAFTPEGIAPFHYWRVPACNTLILWSSGYSLDRARPMHKIASRHYRAFTWIFVVYFASRLNGNINCPKYYFAPTKKVSSNVAWGYLRQYNKTLLRIDDSMWDNFIMDVNEHADYVNSTAWDRLTPLEQYKQLHIATYNSMHGEGFEEVSLPQVWVETHLARLEAQRLRDDPLYTPLGSFSFLCDEDWWYSETHPEMMSWWTGYTRYFAWWAHWWDEIYDDAQTQRNQYVFYTLHTYYTPVYPWRHEPEYRYSPWKCEHSQAKWRPVWPDDILDHPWVKQDMPYIKKVAFEESDDYTLLALMCSSDQLLKHVNEHFGFVMSLHVGFHYCTRPLFCIHNVWKYGAFWSLEIGIRGTVFLFFQAYEYCTSLFNVSDSIYGGTFFALTGLHGIHVAVGIVLVYGLIPYAFHKWDHRWDNLDLFYILWTHHIAWKGAAWYWHFVDTVWLYVFMIVYVWGFPKEFYDVEDISPTIFARAWNFVRPYLPELMVEVLETVYPYVHVVLLYVFTSIFNFFYN